MSSTLFTSLSPNTESDDIRLALRLLFSPWQWVKQAPSRAEDLESSFRAYLSVPHALAFSSGRSALYAILASLGLQKGDEVLLQAFTCVAVPDPILWAGLKPIYADCDENTFTLSQEDLKKRITPRSRVLIIQHSFGQPADMDALLSIAREHRLFVIEDCAHALGAAYYGKPLGTFGDASFFSFGRDKVISSVFGGMAVTRDPDLARRLLLLRDSFQNPPRWWVVQQLLHPVILWISKTAYSFFSVGKVILELAKRFGLISKAVYSQEKRGGEPPFLFWRMPDALAVLALHQFKKLDRFNAHRKAIAKRYSEALQGEDLISQKGADMDPRLQSGVDPIYLRYSIRVPDAALWIRAAQKEHLLLGDWYNTPIAPIGVDCGIVGYRAVEYPVAERLAREVLNLPTHIQITTSDADRVIGFIKKGL
ncbi:aminotransferase class I/II-fold pyridoxal phosphate-dependent enzyme [Candidatus Peregrinibacteria bacterium]|nr:aminotransferase class I/II-fold pyridoxal phosphate-dependent enzyme [Candidatus Peregrinibacteria bacterium]